MSSESSEVSKSEKALKPNSESRSVKKSQSSKESDGNKTSRGSHNSVKNFPTQPKVTVLEQLNFKKATVDLYHNGRPTFGSINL